MEQQQEHIHPLWVYTPGGCKGPRRNRWVATSWPRRPIFGNDWPVQEGRWRPRYENTKGNATGRRRVASR